MHEINKVSAAVTAFRHQLLPHLLEYILLLDNIFWISSHTRPPSGQARSTRNLFSAKAVPVQILKSKYVFR